jgi:serine phosphatase RsbU (regulator of sigma subunit)
VNAFRTQRALRSALAAWSRRLGRVSPWIVDGVLAIAVAMSVSDYRDANTRSPDVFAYALATAIGALVLARRRWPVGVLLASIVVLQSYHGANYPGLPASVPLAVALYTTAATGHLRWSLGVSAVYLTGTAIYAGLFSESPGEVVNEGVRDGALLVAVVLFGDAVRSHRALMAEAAARLRRAEEDRKREEQELSAARVIQLQLLPKELPVLSGWRLAAHYQPARAVGGDFYDVVPIAGGRIALIAGDVTDKGIPAALVMATTHGILRGDAPALVDPGAVLARANDRLHDNIPDGMFVTCLYAVLDPASGRLRFANAGHNLPYQTTADGVAQLRATGMPLGALPGMTYEEHETCLAPGDLVLLSSDGLVEAHNAAGEMFGFPRLRQVVETSRGGESLIDECLAALRAFVGRDWEQEDDITLVTLQRERD